MDNIIDAVVADRYDQCMAVIEERGQLAVAATMEMWNAMLEIYSRKLWRGHFNTTDEWIDYIGELGYTGMSRSTIFFKLTNMKSLMDRGVKQELAAAAVTSVPGAVRMLSTSAEFKAAVKDADPNEYIKELIYLPGREAIGKVRDDKGNRVSMWLKEIRLGVRPGELVALVVRSDARGYTAYDVKVTVEPQIPGNRDLLSPVSSWLVNKMGGHLDNTKIK